MGNNKILNLLENLHLKHKPISVHTGKRYPEIKQLGDYARSLPPGQRAKGILQVLQENGYEKETIWFQNKGFE